MTQALENTIDLPEEQRFLRRGLSWEQFKAIQASFANVPGVRLFYCEGILEIVSIGKPHEAIKCLMAGLLITYFEVKGIEFFPSGSFTQAIPKIVEYQADLSYCFGKDKSVPDLCIEVVITSGSPIKLQKYKLMGVQEVWFWEDGTFKIYCLREQEYEKVVASELLTELDLSLLNGCLLLSSPLEAVREFRQHLG
ncbi:MAG: Uma2 family endonuclease [Desmonostoc vinosum HA7617-LM4]|jgi:Uma2 family endonuclease|nr:Uma2 family endonuclease [Desmonostoc vinosum HA7617-LM4]